MQGMPLVSITEQSEAQPTNLNQIMVELDQYRKQSEELALINELHRRLAGAVDLQGIIEAFSIWLMPIVEHEVVAYQHPDKDCSHVICSSHGPERREILELAEQFFSQPLMDDCLDGTTQGEFLVRCWNLPKDERGLLLLLQKGNVFDEGKKDLLDGAVAVVEGPLQRAVYYEKLIEQATRDALTGLANRRVFDERIDSFLERARRNNRHLTLASMDLDNFKRINDSLGHAEGDRVLCEVAQILSETVRKSDLLVRMGGDEFVLVLPDTAIGAAKKLADRICRAVCKLAVRTPDGDQLGISIGLVQWNLTLTSEEWVQRADEILYQAKAAGRSQVCFEDLKRPIAQNTSTK